MFFFVLISFLLIEMFFTQKNRRNVTGVTMRSAAFIKEELTDDLMILSIYRSFSSRGRERLLHIQDMGRGPNSVFWVNHNSRHLARGPSLYIRQSSVLPSFFVYVGH
jgi:hypothetical protein